MSDIAVEFREVVKRFGEFQAVNGVSFDIKRGEFLTLLGPSGCGKTTLLRMLAGFEAATSGDILIDGKSVVDKPPYERPIGMVFQNLALFPHLTAAENIAFGLRLKSVPKKTIAEKVEAALDLVGLPGQGGKRVGQLSGGQRQRIALARSLVVRPSVLLLDEPLSALDLKLRRQMQIELKAIQRRSGTTFVFVTHDQEEALTMSDRIAVMNQGRVEQLGSATEIYHYPQTPFAANFVGEMNALPAEVVALTDAGAMIRLVADNVVLGPVPGRHALAVGARILACARPENVTLAAAGDPPGLRLQAQVVEQHYSGSTLRRDLLAGNQPLIMRGGSDPMTDRNLVGQVVDITVGLDHLRLVARGE